MVRADGDFMDVRQHSGNRINYLNSQIVALSRHRDEAQPGQQLILEGAADTRLAIECLEKRQILVVGIPYGVSRWKIGHITDRSKTFQNFFRGAEQLV
jgi:hypothetical protein